MPGTQPKRRTDCSDSSGVGLGFRVQGFGVSGFEILTLGFRGLGSRVRCRQQEVASKPCFMQEL